MTYSLPKLLDKFSTTSSEDEKLNYLISIAYLLKNVPKAILIDQLPSVSIRFLFLCAFFAHPVL